MTTLETPSDATPELPEQSGDRIHPDEPAHPIGSAAPQRIEPRPYPVAPAPQVIIATSPPVNGMAITSFILSLLLLSIPAVILGHLALKRIRRTGEGGRGLAIAGLVLGYIDLAVVIIIAVAVLVPLIAGAVLISGAAVSTAAL